MKNTFVLPSKEPSRLHSDGKELFITINLQLGKTINSIVESRNIYITNSEEIKEGDYWVYLCPINGLDFGDNGNPIVKNKLPSSWFEKLHDRVNYKKIILTTDPELIKNGVQSIDDDFLEWFVDKANDSGKPIDIVEVDKMINVLQLTDREYCYKPIIPQPKQEIHICKHCNAETTQSDDECYAKPKQETIEVLSELELNKEARRRNLDFAKPNDFADGWRTSFQFMNKHQSEKMFSYKQVELITNEMVNWAIENVGNQNPQSGKKFDEVVNKHKKH